MNLEITFNKDKIVLSRVDMDNVSVNPHLIAMPQRVQFVSRPRSSFLPPFNAFRSDRSEIKDATAVWHDIRKREVGRFVTPSFQKRLLSLFRVTLTMYIDSDTHQVVWHPEHWSCYDHLTLSELWRDHVQLHMEWLLHACLIRKRVMPRELADLLASLALAYFGSQQAGVDASSEEPKDRDWRLIRDSVARVRKKVETQLADGIIRRSSPVPFFSMSKEDKSQQQQPAKKNKWPCPEKPELLKGQPIGMYHCPYCDEMQLAGSPHLPPQDPSQWQEPFPKTAEPEDEYDDPEAWQVKE